MECIICKDLGLELLQDNTACRCKYKRHNSCWIDYVHSTKKVKCLICRKEITSNTNLSLIPQNIVPYTSYEELSYQEFNDIRPQLRPINISIQIQNDILVFDQQQQQQQQQQTSNIISTKDKINKTILLIAIVISIVLLIVFVL